MVLFCVSKFFIFLKIVRIITYLYTQCNRTSLFIKAGLNMRDVGEVRGEGDLIPLVMGFVSGCASTAVTH